MSVFKGYNKTAFNNYDIIFSNGKYQEEEIRIQEKIYGLNQKKIMRPTYLGATFQEYSKRNMVITICPP